MFINKLRPMKENRLADGFVIFLIVPNDKKLNQTILKGKINSKVK